MISSFCSWVLHQRMGWTANVIDPLPDKCIIAIAPHTSNWDFIIAEMHSLSRGMKSNFLMKKEWFFWPLGPLFRHLGGIPVWRSKHTSMTDNLAATAAKMSVFQLGITPEGTRSPNAEWKKGFYFIAQKANIPILLYGLDYEQKHIECTKVVIPEGDVEEQMREIMLYFKKFKGKHPENFKTGDL